MKFLHISDLHIGKRVHEFSMIEDQKYILKQILDIAKKEQVDGVMIAGDIYDKSVPSSEAVQVFDWFLTELAAQGRKIFAISGNHDSAERIAFGAQLMRSKEVYLSPVYDGKITGIPLEDEYGTLYVWLLPFLKPAVVRHAFEGKEEEIVVESYNDAVRLAIEHMKTDRSKRNVILAHQFVTGATRCESEDISVGGIDNIDAELFEAFDYAALGHIHSPQSVGRETVRYCGTPLKYSFSEVEQKKTATVVEFLEKGNVKITAMPLVPLHDMRKIRGTYQEVMTKKFYEATDTGDYVQITLTDEEDIVDGLYKLRSVYPNIMQLFYDNKRTRESRVIDKAEEIQKKSELELFAEFYELQNNQPVNEKQMGFVETLFAELEEREYKR